MDYKGDLIVCDMCGGTGAIPDDDGEVITLPAMQRGWCDLTMKRHDPESPDDTEYPTCHGCKHLRSGFCDVWNDEVDTDYRCEDFS